MKLLQFETTGAALGALPELGLGTYQHLEDRAAHRASSDRELCVLELEDEDVERLDQRAFERLRAELVADVPDGLTRVELKRVYLHSGLVRDGFRTSARELR